MVLTLSAEGKKWSLRICEREYGGKMWESMVGESGGNSSVGDYPRSNESPDILTIPNFPPYKVIHIPFFDGVRQDVRCG